MTIEMRYPGPNWPDALILRWKNAPLAAMAALGVPPTGLTTHSLVLELQGGTCSGCIPPLVPNRSSS